MCTCDLCFEEIYYFSSESLLHIAYACFCNILINKQPFIGKNNFKRRENEKRETR